MTDLRPSERRKARETSKPALKLVVSPLHRRDALMARLRYLLDHPGELHGVTLIESSTREIWSESETPGIVMALEDFKLDLLGRLRE